MKLIIDIPEDDREDICNIHFVREDLKFKVGKAIMNGTPFDSVIEDIKAEIKFYESDSYCFDTDECEQCTANTFGSIYRIIDKHGKEYK